MNSNRVREVFDIAPEPAALPVQRRREGIHEKEKC